MATGLPKLSNAGKTRVRRARKPKQSFVEMAGNKALGVLETVGEGLSSATLYPLTNAIMAFQDNKSIPESIVKGVKGEGVSTEKPETYTGVLKRLGADPKAIGTKVVAGGLNLVADPINALFPGRPFAFAFVIVNVGL